MNPVAFEPVVQVDDFYDGVRSGVAIIRGERCKFMSRRLDATEYRGDLESVDIFEIQSLERPGAPALLATVEFRETGERPGMGQLPLMEAKWEIIGECAV